MVCFLVGTGFEEMELIAPCDILRRGGVEVCLAGIGGKAIKGSHGVTIQTEVTAEEIDPETLEMIVLPGGLGGVASIRGSKAAMDAVKAVYLAGKFVAAICAAPTILAELGITDGKEAVCYPGMEAEMGSAILRDADATADGKVICGRAAGAAIPFGLELLKALRGNEAAENVRRGIVYTGGKNA